MFEKEAEEFERRKHYRYEDNDYCGDIADGIIQAYQQGAEFGYNKANEWHCASKGEYPKECENVLCYCKVVNVEFYSIGHIIIGGDNKIRWWSSNRREELNVYAWREIVSPKEIQVTK